MEEFDEEEEPFLYSSLPEHKFTYRRFCEFLEEHPNLDHNAFDRLKDEFLGESQDESLYPLIRLFFPVKDKRKFNLTERSLKKVLESFLHSNISNVKLSPQVFASAVHNEFHGSSSFYSIATINRYLDLLWLRRAKRRFILQKMAVHMSLVELKYLFAIMLDEISDCVTGKKTGTTVMLGFVSPLARQFLNSGIDLKNICEGLRDSKMLNSDMLKTLVLSKPVRPMLLSRLSCSSEDITKVIKFCGRPFYIETKYDGEHFLVHRMDGEYYMFYSRNGNDYSEQLGIDSGTGFASRIHKHFEDSVEDCVLDCELVVWDKENNKIIGKNKQTDDGRVVDVKFLEDTSKICRCLVVFDILLLNGQGFLETPLKERLKILKSNVFKSTAEGTVILSSPTEISRIKDFYDFYMDHMKRGEEGVVIKGKSTLYKFGQRAIVNGWFKVKPDYGARLTLDLALVAIKYSDTSCKSIKSFFIAALADDGDYKIVGGVQCALKKSDFEQLIGSLDMNNSLSSRPSWIKGTYEDKTVKYCQLDNIQVVEVKASGLLNDRLQFPVITALRNDKFADEVNLVTDVLSYNVDLREGKRHLPQNEFVIQKAKRRRVVPGTGTVEKSTENKINQAKVYVVDDFRDTASVKDAKAALRNFGFTVFENFTDSVNFVVSISSESRKAKKIIEKETVNVISIQWIQRCKESSRVLLWQSSDFIQRSSDYTLEVEEEEPDRSQKEEEEDFVPDESEGHYNLQEEEEEYVPLEAEPSTWPVDEVEGLSVNDLVDDNPIPAGEWLFKDLVFFFVDTPDHQETIITENGGTVSRELNTTVTHLVFLQKYDFVTDSQQILDFISKNGWNVVLIDEEWLKAAVNEGDRYKDSRSIAQLSNNS